MTAHSPNKPNPYFLPKRRRNRVELNSTNVLEMVEAAKYAFKTMDPLSLSVVLNDDALYGGLSGPLFDMPLMTPEQIKGAIIHTLLTLPGTNFADVSRKVEVRANSTGLGLQINAGFDGGPCISRNFGDLYKRIDIEDIFSFVQVIRAKAEERSRGMRFIDLPCVIISSDRL